MKRKNLLKRSKGRVCLGIPQFSYSKRGKTKHALSRFAQRVPLGINLPSLYQIREMLAVGSQLVTVEKCRHNRKKIFLHNIGYLVVTDNLINHIISVIPIK